MTKPTGVSIIGVQLLPAYEDIDWLSKDIFLKIQVCFLRMIASYQSQVETNYPTTFINKLDAMVKQRVDQKLIKINESCYELMNIDSLNQKYIWLTIGGGRIFCRKSLPTQFWSPNITIFIFTNFKPTLNFSLNLKLTLKSTTTSTSTPAPASSSRGPSHSIMASGSFRSL